MTEYLHVNGGSIAYDVAGDGPLVVLAHGLADDRFAYRFVTPRLLEQGCRVAALDLRGCGESSTDWARWDRTAIADDLIAIIRHLGGPALVVGHSIAGGAAIIAAAREPSLVTAVVGLGPVTRKQSISLKALRVSSYRRAFVALALAATFGSRAHWLRYVDMAYPGVRPADWTERRRRFDTQLADPGRMNAFQKMARTSAADAGHQLPHVHQPVLVIMGGSDPDWADPAAEAAAIVGELPAGVGHVHMVDSAGHYTHDQQPEQVATHVLRVLERGDIDA